MAKTCAQKLFFFVANSYMCFFCCITMLDFTSGRYDSKFIFKYILVQTRTGTKSGHDFNPEINKRYTFSHF